MSALYAICFGLLLLVLAPSVALSEDTATNLPGSWRPLPEDVRDATDIVIGKFTDIGREGMVTLGGVHYGGARVSISITLKGNSSGFLLVSYAAYGSRRPRVLSPNLADTYIVITSAKTGATIILHATNENIAKIKALMDASTSSK